jgi:hypothetical protein
VAGTSCDYNVYTHRLDEVQDKRQGMIQRLKISEKEKDALEGKKAEAELFLAKQVGKRVCRRSCRLVGVHPTLLHQYFSVCGNQTPARHCPCK